MCGEREELPHLTHDQWDFVKDICAQANIKKFIPRPEERDRFYRIVARQFKSVEGVKQKLEQLYA